MMNTNPKDIEHVLTSGVADVLPSRDGLAKIMASGKRLRLYVGIDPTSPHLHLGHALQFMKLREFQDLGHEVILLIGSFTAMIGDPTDKLAARKQLTRKEVLANAKTYKKQVGKILNFAGRNGVAVKFNDKWLAKLSFADVVELASNFTVQQMLERDMFAKRASWKAPCPKCGSQTVLPGRMGSDTLIFEDMIKTQGFSMKCSICSHVFIPSVESLISPSPIHMHEFFYPLMQGYDSVAMDVDVELGGSDQTFNMLAGRTLQKAINGKEKFVVSLKLLTNDEGKKMSKSEGGMIGLEDSPEDKYGKIMAMSDSMILPYYELVLRKSAHEVAEFSKIKEADPRGAKAQLAREVVTFFDSAEAALKAEEYFNKVFRSHEVPEEMPEHALAGEVLVIDALVETGLVTSKSEARRMIEQGAIKINSETVTSMDATVKPGVNTVLQRGKRQFVRLK